jgi:pyruvate dehydrogenase E1 component beta subunit
MPWDDALVNKKGKEQVLSGLGSRTITYTEAINEALDLALTKDESVFVLGQGVTDPGAMFGITKNLELKFGNERVFETPVSEEGLTGFCVGAALSGKRPVYLHNRPDFLLLTFNQIVTHASKYHYMSRGQSKVPMVIWSAIGRGWGSGAQHSQAIQGLLLGVPGLKIVMPMTPYDAKGLMLSAIEDNNPVLIFEHRWLMKRVGPVPEGYYTVPLGKALVRKEGIDVTIVGASQILETALEAAFELENERNLKIEVIDLRTIQPLDEESILCSVKKTGRLVVVDTGWAMGGVCAEIGCLVAEKAFHNLKSPVQRVGLPHSPTPSGYELESAFYPTKNIIKEAILKTLQS